MNVVIGLKWMWRERGIVNAAHSGGMLAADTAKPGTKTKPEGNTSGQRWPVIDTIDPFSSRGGEVSAKNAQRPDAMMGNKLSYPPG